MKATSLALTKSLHQQLEQLLYPGDGKEAVTVALCGFHDAPDRLRLLVHELVPIPWEDQKRNGPSVTWLTRSLPSLLDRCADGNLCLLKIHSHPGGFDRFSEYDNTADRELFPGIYGWSPGSPAHASAVMLPTGRIFARVVCRDNSFHSIASVLVCGDNIDLWFDNDTKTPISDTSERTAQAFGEQTCRLLEKLTIGVVGCSGTGTPIIEQLARLGVAGLVIVDSEKVERRNLNRMIGATAKDAAEGALKVNVVKRNVEAMGLGTHVQALAIDILTIEAVTALAGCDILFGCMDSADGRQTLNRIATYYCQPYFDIGVRLEADGHGGVREVCGGVHYLQPGGSSLLSRGVITLDQVRADSLKRKNPAEYEKLRKDKYIVGASEGRPAVIPVNMLFASLAMNDFLARIHPYRTSGNAGRDWWSISLANEIDHICSFPEPCKSLRTKVGRGDIIPRLGYPSLS